MALLLIRHIIG